MPVSHFLFRRQAIGEEIFLFRGKEFVRERSYPSVRDPIYRAMYDAVVYFTWDFETRETKVLKSTTFLSPNANSNPADHVRAMLTQHFETEQWKRWRSGT